MNLCTVQYTKDTQTVLIHFQMSFRHDLPHQLSIIFMMILFQLILVISSWLIKENYSSFIYYVNNKQHKTSYSFSVLLDIYALNTVFILVTILMTLKCNVKCIDIQLPISITEEYTGMQHIQD